MTRMDGTMMSRRRRVSPRGSSSRPVDQEEEVVKEEVAEEEFEMEVIEVAVEVVVDSREEVVEVDDERKECTFLSVFNKVFFFV